MDIKSNMLMYKQRRYVKQELEQTEGQTWKQLLRWGVVPPTATAVNMTVQHYM